MEKMSENTLKSIFTVKKQILNTSALAFLVSITQYRAQHRSSLCRDRDGVSSPLGASGTVSHCCLPAPKHYY